MAGHPKNVIFLTCDAFGVLPPVAKLSSGQAMYQFLSGYTAKVAGTERGVTEPTATFSACYGAAFLTVHPTRYADLLQQKLKDHGSNVYLVNTGWTGGAYGVGERMSIKDTRSCIDAIQTYIQYPYLLNGYKFTLRIYVTYTSISPLQLYIYPEGFVHMATDKYNSNPKYINERYMHLTNPDINKERDFYKKNPRPFYWNFVELKNYVKKHGKMNSGPNGHDDDDLWYDIQTLVMKTVLSAEYKLNNFAIKFTQNINNFELLGIDVLVDSNLKPWLVEVNPDPDSHHKTT